MVVESGAVVVVVSGARDVVVTAQAALAGLDVPPSKTVTVPASTNASIVRRPAALRSATAPAATATRPTTRKTMELEPVEGRQDVNIWREA